MHRFPWRGDTASGKQPPQNALFWALAIVVPLVTIVSTHVWLRTAYTRDLFHPDGFLAQYTHGIYRYRVLGPDVLLFIYHHLLTRFHDHPLAMPGDPHATLLFYASYVILNFVCFAASNFLLLLLLSDRQQHLSDLRLAIYLYLTLIQTCAMAVVTPYDQLAYLFILLSFFAAKIQKGRLAYPLLALAAVAGALTRETQALVTPALFSIALFSAGSRSRRFWIAGSCNLVLFALVYVALRIFVPGPKIISGGASYGGQSALIAGLILALLLFIGTVLALRAYADIRPTVALLVLSSPYIVSILISGALRELRLLVPILLAQAFLYVQLHAENPAADKHPAKIVAEAQETLV